MKILTFSFFAVIVLSVDAFAGYGGNIGLKDDRQYDNLSNPLYSSVARFDANGKPRCTAGFVSENIIITNHHCADLCARNKCSIYFWDGKQYQTSDVNIIAMPKEYSTKDGTDWALFKSDVPNKNFKTVAFTTTGGAVLRGGYGTLRVISDDEIPIIKKAFGEARRTAKCAPSEDKITCVNKVANEILQKQHNIPSLFNDNEKFKTQRCDIHTISEGLVRTTCDSSGGDSGAPLLRGNQLVALNNSGNQSVFGESEKYGAYALNTINFYQAVQDAVMGRWMPPISFGGSAQNDANADSVIATDPQEIQSIMENRLLDFQCD